MGLNANLPALVPGVIAFIVLSVGAMVALAWSRQAEIQRIVRWTWFAGTIFIVAGVAIFWLSTAMVEGPKRAIVDRGLQNLQQNELRQRLDHGGH
ncbi:MAG TPA: hypothetical protein VN154_10510 [Rhizomicrobium sp.]|nr:hypothetical protein [Rhizomicrobium sp.]